MKILNWNVCSFNKNQHKTIIRALEFGTDILCLQEVTLQSLEFLKGVAGYQLAYVQDSNNKNGGCYLVTMSKLPLQTHGVNTYYNQALRSLYSQVAKLVTGEKQVFNSLYVDIEYDGKTVRIYNLHLSWPVGSHIRICQFTNFANQIATPQMPKVICGDLNIFGSLKFYNCLAYVPFGYTRSDLKIDERLWFDEKFIALELQNPLANTISWPLIPFRAQLDHVLISKDLKVAAWEQVKNRYGSDHTAYLVELII